MGPLGISLMVSNTKINGGGWKGEEDFVELEGETFAELFTKKCNYSNYSRVLECFNTQSFSTEEIYKRVYVNNTNLRNVLSLNCK